MTLALVGEAPDRLTAWRALDAARPARVVLGVAGDTREWVWSWCGLHGVPWEPWRPGLERLDLSRQA